MTVNKVFDTPQFWAVFPENARRRGSGTMLIMAEIVCQSLNQHRAGRLEIHHADDHTLNAPCDTEHGHTSLESEYGSLPSQKRL